MKWILLFVMQLMSVNVIAQNYNEDIKTYREEYKKEFLEDERLPIKPEDLKYLRFYEPDENYRVVADFSRTENSKAVDFPTSAGKTKSYIEYGKLKFKLNNAPYTLTIFQSVALMEKPEYRDYLFLPFTDSTSGYETYGNGRYLDFKMGDITDGKLVVDFNKAYNPLCAFATGFNCPRPPAENMLPIAIKAGEKNFGKVH